MCRKIMNSYPQSKYIVYGISCFYRLKVCTYKQYLLIRSETWVTPPYCMCKALKQCLRVFTDMNRYISPK